MGVPPLSIQLAWLVSSAACSGVAAWKVEVGDRDLVKRKRLDSVEYRIIAWKRSCRYHGRIIDPGVEIDRSYAMPLTEKRGVSDSTRERGSSVEWQNAIPDPSSQPVGTPFSTARQQGLAVMAETLKHIKDLAPVHKTRKLGQDCKVPHQVA
ncbi:hypothetical protein PAAG_05819 [Paracoccidioides lutzii Pb01]|uniref:Uncharacterized protein n=1 Tax=Paracoccidioides lutzii (strain ATCC MYA-826 / Pb01) TaxID=502779 RepID=C1H4X8_PARBA|nr:hypothetical protein PAAG_05819 [Paracoccidioides lutzii Pb01]EEH34772.2 hypothetical protein PAAG_05819 [Paracoccidioides lutzii Pb01]